MNAGKLRAHEAPSGIATSSTFVVQARTTGTSWVNLATYAVDVADANATRNEFNKYPISVASFEGEGAVDFNVEYTTATVEKAAIRPVSLGIKTVINNNTITFSLERPLDVMLEVNGDKWQALHILYNEFDPNEPTGDTENVWCFGPGVDNGSAYSKVVDGNLLVPSNTTVYLRAGAFLTAKLNLLDVTNSGVRGHGFIYKGPNGGAILIERSSKITVEGVTSLGATGFSLTAGEARDVRINRYRSFSSHGNGDGVDFFCCQDILVENCFLRNSDDTVAIYGHRWDYYGDTRNITVRDCTLLPDIAHPIQIGTHGNPAKPETFSNIKFSNIDILDHYENQIWYQGCISINAGDENLIKDVLIEDIRIERISKGQLVNIRVMKNDMWTTAPGRGVQNVMIKNVELNMDNSKIVNPSQILGFNEERRVENVTFENIKIGDVFIHNEMRKPRWYMVTDFVPMFVNEHASHVKFILAK